jgi:lytic murein transglycosylase
LKNERLAGLAATCLAAASLLPHISLAQAAPASGGSRPATVVTAPTPPGFRACVDQAASDAIRQGAPAAAARAAVAGIAGPDAGVIEASQRQPERRLAIWDYLAAMVDDERAVDGGNAYLSQAPYLRQLGIDTGVDPATVAAIWGVETNFGRILGNRPVINSLATLGCTQWRRTAYFRSELVAAIRVQAHGHVMPEHFVGSWAGAFGQTQFMPTSFWSLAVDGTGDGRRDIIDEPRDALASTANFLRRSGWVRGEAWGYEVRTPAGFAGAVGRDARRSLDAWRAAGFTRADGAPLPGGAVQYGIIYPGGRNGPGFLVGRNFEAVRRYNPVDAYALAVNILADRIKGGPGVVQAWPVADAPLSRVERRELQRGLIALGYDIGAPDGLIGPRTLEALRALGVARGVDLTPDDDRISRSTLEGVRAAQPR